MYMYIYRSLQKICNSIDISFRQYICLHHLLLNVGGYFSIDNRLSVLPIFSCDMYSSDIGRYLQYINITNVLRIGPALVTALNQPCLALEAPSWDSKLLMVLFLVTKCVSSTRHQEQPPNWTSTFRHQSWCEIFCLIANMYCVSSWKRAIG